MNTATTVIHSARLVSSAGTVPDAWVRFDGDRITARGLGDDGGPGGRDGAAAASPYPLSQDA